MTNDEKAEMIAERNGKQRLCKNYDDCCRAYNSTDDCFSSAMQMAEWKDEQYNQTKQQLYNIIIALWDILDKIDTFSDLQIDDINPNNPFRKIEHITQERHKFVKSDGYNLYIDGE